MSDESQSRRKFLSRAASAAAGTVMVMMLPKVGGARVRPEELADGSYDWDKHYWTYVIDTRKCIGCGNCVRACKKENGVSDVGFRTWVERYAVTDEEHIYDDEPTDPHIFIDSPNGGHDGFPPQTFKKGVNVVKAFFVPKLCNHCRHTPCVQVCPVHASYSTPDGVVLVDKEMCIGCGYCVQACPYGSRHIDPVSHTADKCTWCYHRITKGLLPACVTVCPTNTRMFGDLKEKDSPIKKLIESERVAVLKKELKTEPFCFYLGFDYVIT